MHDSKPLAIPLLLLSCFLLVACEPAMDDEAENAGASASDPTSEVVLGTIDTIDSTILDEERDLWIYLPRSAQEQDNERIFPVVYLLDGNGHFRSVSGMIYQLSTVNGNQIVPEMIVVGIPNTDRFRDLTPTHTEGSSGGGTAFLDFIENEVIPHVEANYPASQYRTFIGHSLGGLMAIEALITRPEVFTNYISIDPSLWWDDQSVLFRAEAALSERDFSGKSLFVSVANTMPARMSVEEVVADEQDRTTHIRSILQFSRRAEAETRSGLNFEWAYYDDDTHGSVPLISEYDALRFLFPWYNPDFERRSFSDPNWVDNPRQLQGFVEGHYATISEHLGVNYLPPLRWVNSIAVGMRMEEKPQSALAIAQLNLSNYPESPITHESMGDYYLWQEDEESARIHFQHALERGAQFELEEKFNQTETSQAQ